MKTWTLALTLVALPLTVFAQDGKTDEPTPKKIIVLEDEEEDGDGNKARRVIVIEGDDKLDEKTKKKLKAGKAKAAKLKLKLGDGDFDFDFDLGLKEGDLKQLGDLNKSLGPILKSVQERLKESGIDLKAMIGKNKMLQRVLDPKARAKWIEGMRNRARLRTAEGRRADAIKSLALSKEEAAVIVPLLDGVLTKQRALTKAQQSRRAQLKKNATATSDAAAAKKLTAAFRAAAKQDAKALAEAREKLRELLTPKQEINLVLRDILD